MGKMGRAEGRSHGAVMATKIEEHKNKNGLHRAVITTKIGD
ncbi:hypothetical protein [Cytobacillus oceanisediminis]|nr:hypothetical protein [Cytobacillus oceanisediminis]